LAYPTIEAAAICAASRSFGGASVIVPNASRNIVWQKGLANPITAAPALPVFGARHIDAFALFFAEKHKPAAGAATEGALAGAARIAQLAEAADHLARGRSVESKPGRHGFLSGWGRRALRHPHEREVAYGFPVSSPIGGTVNRAEREFPVNLALVIPTSGWRVTRAGQPRNTCIFRSTFTSFKPLAFHSISCTMIGASGLTAKRLHGWAIHLLPSAL
jgi:hypothetical protein